ncbi:MAG: hypothetical protein ACRD0H_26845, partial [Actinomycetes bacterium]
MTKAAAPVPAQRTGLTGGRPHPGDPQAASLPGSGLRARPFVLLAAGQAVSRLGDGLFATALAWMALRSSGTAGVALVASAATAPLLAGSVIGASWSDRHDRRRLMIGADLTRLGVGAGLAAALAGGPAPVWA